MHNTHARTLIVGWGMECNSASVGAGASRAAASVPRFCFGTRFYFGRTRIIQNTRMQPTVTDVGVLVMVGAIVALYVRNMASLSTR